MPNNKNDINKVYLITELCDQGDLYEFQQKFYSQFDLETKLSFSIQIAQGLQHLHKQDIVHRDLKPENCLVKSLQNSQASCFHEKFQIKIGDFGLSLINNRSSSLKSQIGTPNYMAPEIIKGDTYSQQVDIWSLGCIIYEIFTNKQLFFGNKLVSIINATLQHNNNSEYIKEEYQESKNINQLLKQCLAENPSERLNINKIVNQLIYIYERVKSSKSKSEECFKINYQESKRDSTATFQNQQFQPVEKEENNFKKSTIITEEEDIYIINSNNSSEKENDFQKKSFNFLLKNNIQLQNVDYLKPMNEGFNNKTKQQVQQDDVQDIEFYYQFEQPISPRGQKYKIEKELKMKEYQNQQKNIQGIQNKKMIVCDSKSVLFANKQYALKYIENEGLQSQIQNRVVITNKNNQLELSQQDANFAYSFNFLIAQIILYEQIQIKNINYQDQYLITFKELFYQLKHQNKNEFLEFVEEINKPEYTSLEKLLKLFEICEKHLDLLQQIDTNYFMSSLQNDPQTNQDPRQLIEQTKSSHSQYNILTQIQIQLIRSLKSGQNIILQDQNFSQKISNILNKAPQKTLNCQQEELLKQLQSFYSVKNPKLF
ncbi:hypothetical protein ABPG72_001402 [Tetrahymena utriculariae]